MKKRNKKAIYTNPLRTSKKESFNNLMKDLEDILITGLGEKDEIQLTRISENELEHVIRHFNNKSIYLYLDGIISCRNTIHKAKCEYDIQKRFFYYLRYHKRRHNQNKHGRSKPTTNQ